MTTDRPILISVLLLAYQQETMVRAAVESILAQEGDPIEIVISDDASTDGTFAEIERAVADYRGPHHVVMRRNPVNLGIGAHLNALVACSRGELLMVAAGDDISEPSRAREVAEAWLESGKSLDLIATPLLDMDAEGHCSGEVVHVGDLRLWKSADDWIANRPKVIGAAHAWTRRVFDHFGPLDADIAYEDQVLAFRALASGGATTLPRPLVRYRRGGTSARGDDRQVTAAKRERIAVQNRRHLAELGQMQADSKLTGWREAVAPYLIQELNKQGYLAGLLAAGSGWGRVLLMLRSPGLPMGWRWRKFWQVAAADRTG
jgi:hypothetical protein